MVFEYIHLFCISFLVLTYDKDLPIISALNAMYSGLTYVDSNSTSEVCNPGKHFFFQFLIFLFFFEHNLQHFSSITDNQNDKRDSKANEGSNRITLIYFIS